MAGGDEARAGFAIGKGLNELCLARAGEVADFLDDQGGGVPASGQGVLAGGWDAGLENVVDEVVGEGGC